MEMGESLGPATPPPEDSLPADGERFIPGSMTGEIELEHIHRYKFAAQLCARRVVLDIACGEGYGSAYLAAVARQVTGVDISENAIAHARGRYRLPNLEFAVGECAAIPLGKAAVDVVVSFETIEHLAEHEAMLREIKRVLRPRGTLIISSPDKREYSDKAGLHNPFHVKELYREEFEALLGKHFRHARYFGQRVLYGSALFLEAPAQELEFHDVALDSKSRDILGAPKYWVAVASNAPLRKLKGGLLEGDASRIGSAGDLASAKSACAILKVIAGPASSRLKEKLNDPWYLQRNPDVSAEGVDPYEHWMTWGAGEGRLPAPDVESLALELNAEREAPIHAALVRSEQELRDARADWLARQHALEEAHLQALTERERVFAGQLTELQTRTGQERDAQHAALAHELAAARAEYDRREQRNRGELAEHERRFQEREQALLERQRNLEAELERARQQIEAELRAHAERERTFADQLMQQQRVTAEEQQKERVSANALAQLILSQREQSEQRLQAAVADREREVRNLRREAADQQKAAQAVLAQHRVALQYANDSRTRALAVQERARAEQLAREQQLAREERDAQRQAAARELAAARVEHEEGTERLRAQFEEQAGELRRNSATLLERLRILESELERTQLTSRDQLEAQLHTLAEREREFAEELAQLHGRAQEELAGLREASARQLVQTRAEHAEQLQGLETRLNASHSREREQAATHLKVALERERAFAQELSCVRDLIDDERRLVRAQYLHATDVMRTRLIANERRPWWSRLLPRNTSSLASELLRTWMACATEIATAAPQDAHRIQAPAVGSRAMRAAKSLDELLSRDDDDFISCLYLSLLGRPPDPKGYRFYLEQLRSTGAKADLISQVARSPEARERKMSLPGLEAFVFRTRLAKLPLFGWLARSASARGDAKSPRILFEELAHRIAQLEEDVARREARLATHLTDPADYVSAVLASFDAPEYVAANPDVAASGLNPYEHFVRFGWTERRWHFGSQNPGPETAVAEAAAATADDTDARPGPWGCVMQPALPDAHGQSYPLTRAMQFVWNSRTDLRDAFDVREEAGRLGFLGWLASHGLRECGLTADVFPRSMLRSLARVGGTLGDFAGSVLTTTASADPTNDDGAAAQADEAFGANLIGYAFGEFGRGEDIRTLAKSLDRVRVPFCVINQDSGPHGTRDDSVAAWVTDKPRFAVNIFLVNADLFPFLPFKLGQRFAVGRYNIGYWAWELSEWPAEFTLALEMVDEVWAISSFVADSVKTRARVPVFTMPDVVTVPRLEAGYTRARYRLPERSFVFYFIFDGASHVDRKNPVAVVRAFKLAFQSGADDVHLLIKAMNVEAAGPFWSELLEEARACERITIITDRMTREEVLGLHVACDAFVSLHRSEGFGRCIAEAMAYGKPAIVTNYSGSRDFAKEGTACVVDYRLIPVAADSYPFSDGQVWAEPDIEHAATLMRRVARDRPYREQIASAGQKYVLDNFSEEAVGRLYAGRLAQIRTPRGEVGDGGAGAQQHTGQATGIFGNIDNPVMGSTPRASDMLSIEGWTTSQDGIEAVKIFVDDAFVADAHYGMLRPDVHSAFPKCPGSGRSGFCLLLNLDSYAEGDHPFRVVAISVSGVTKTWNGMFNKTPSASYSLWSEKTRELYAKAFETRDANSGSVGFSVVLRTEANPDVGAVTTTFASLAGQAYTNMELLCLVSEERDKPLIREAARRARLDVEPRCVLYERGNWIAALSHCRGDFLGVVDPGDTFRPLAFSILDRAVRDSEFPDLVYADEEQRSAVGDPVPLFKPGWSPIFLASHNYIGRPWFAARDTVQTVLSRWAAANDPVSEHELLKAIGINSSAVAHVPTVLVSREHALSDTHPRTAPELDETLAGRPYPKVSIIIPTAVGNEAIVSRCFDSLEHNTDYPDLEIVVVVNNVRDSKATARLLAPRPFKILEWNSSFNWSAINNFGASRATGELLLFMNDDIEPLGPKWLLRLVRTLQRTAAGAAGCWLEYRNGTIQHGGVNFVNYGGGARHLFRFCTGNEARLQWLLQHPREVSAVTGACLLTTRECFDEVNGFDEDLPLVGNDTDYCLRLWQSGRAVIFDPEAKLIHYEGISRQGMSEVKDVDRFWSKWGQFLEHGDFFCNPNVDMTRDDWFLNPAVERIFSVRTRRLLHGNSGIVDEASPLRPPPQKTARVH
jgi:GT2 family glycosyltransferase/glycosyltransferase involved in cell wall biosynthesis/SAM-dependent methyltransferase